MLVTLVHGRLAAKPRVKPISQQLPQPMVEESCGPRLASDRRRGEHEHARLFTSQPCGPLNLPQRVLTQRGSGEVSRRIVEESRLSIVEESRV